MISEFNLDSETWLYIILIVVGAVFFFWNRNRIQTRNRNKKDFRKSYYEKKKDNS